MTINHVPVDGAECLALLGEPQAYSGSPEYWDEAMAAKPAGLLPFLDRESLPMRREAAGLTAEVDAALLRVMEIIQQDAALEQLAWYLHWRMLMAPEHGAPYGAPSLEKRLGEHAGAFYMLLALEWPTRLAAIHRQRGYPPEVTVETIRQIAAFAFNHQRRYGYPGIFASQFPWLATYLRDPYVRLGRLEFQLNPYGGGVNVWRRERDGAVLALAEDGVRVNAEGLRQAQNDPADGWCTSYAEEEAAVAGNPIDPAGYILPGTIRLSRSEWQPYLRRGDMVLNLHIPAGGGMTWEACVESFQRANVFFPQYHPEQPFNALVVWTWFMDPRLARLLPATANPLRLQRACYLYPTAPDAGGLWFVFLQPTENPALLPRDTSLRRALGAFLDAGGTWHGGGMFLLPEDLAAPREGRYLEEFAGIIDDFSL